MYQYKYYYQGKQYIVGFRTQAEAEEFAEVYHVTIIPVLGI